MSSTNDEKDPIQTILNAAGKKGIGPEEIAEISKLIKDNINIEHIDYKINAPLASHDGTKFKMLIKTGALLTALRKNDDKKFEALLNQKVLSGLGFDFDFLDKDNETIISHAVKYFRKGRQEFLKSLATVFSSLTYYAKYNITKLKDLHEVLNHFKSVLGCKNTLEVLERHGLKPITDANANTNATPIKFRLPGCKI